MIYPEFLKENATIGVVAPSFGFTTEPYISLYKNAVDFFNYKIDFSKTCFLDDGTGISTDPKVCAFELFKYYMSKDTDILISAGGGELMCEILEFLDFEKLTRPKWFMGYSDNTNFTFLLNTVLDTASIYGPNFTSFGMNPPHKCLFDSLEILKGERLSVEGYPYFERESLRTDDNPLAGYNLNEKKTLSLFNKGKETDHINISGRITGGCLDCLCTLVGTKFDKVKEFNEKYKDDGIIWFLESCDLSVFGIRRALWQLKNAGWFDNIKGLVIGRPLKAFDEDYLNLNRRSSVLGIMKDIPIILDADIGHMPPSMPIISGSLCEISADTENIRMKFDLR